ncbi:hypothetical protein ABIC84_000664 [Mucilaginibacter sp. 3215]
MQRKAQSAVKGCFELPSIFLRKSVVDLLIKCTTGMLIVLFRSLVVITAMPYIDLNISLLPFPERGSQVRTLAATGD